MDDDGIDAVIATSRPNVHYLSGIDSVSLTMRAGASRCYVVVTRGALDRPALVAHRSEIDQMLDMNPVPSVVASFGEFYREASSGVRLSKTERLLWHAATQRPSYPSADAALAGVIRDLGLRWARIWLDEGGLLPGDASVIAAALPRCTLHHAAHKLRWVRRVKTPVEARNLTHAANVTEQALHSSAHGITVGVSERAVARNFGTALVAAGGTPAVTLVRFGRGGVAGQVRPTRRSLRPNESVWFDVMATVEGYWADLARTYHVGHVERRFRDIYTALLSGVDAGIAAARPGMRAGELHGVVVSAVREAGLKGYRRHHVGHGIGLELYEDPVLAPDSDDTIEEGAVISIEAPYYEFGLGALHVEDPVVVSAGGARRLTSGRRALRSLG
jgi:Xaa-Pro aminopeptidase